MAIPPDRKLVRAKPAESWGPDACVRDGWVPFWFEYDQHGMSLYARSPDGRVFHWDGQVIGPVRRD